MRIYTVELIVSGNNDAPESRVERFVSSGWQEALETMAAIARDTGLVIQSVNMKATQDRPFDYKSIKPS